MRLEKHPSLQSWILLLASLPFLFSLCNEGLADEGRFHRLVRRALEARALHATDCSLPVDPAPVDPFRLAVVDSLLRDPVAIPAWTAGQLERFRAAGARGTLTTLREAYGLLTRVGGAPSPDKSDVALPPADGAGFMEIADAASRLMSDERRRLFSHLAPEEVETLWREAHRLLEESREDRDKDILTLEREKWETAAWGDRLLSTMSRLEMSRYSSAALDVLARLEEAALEGPDSGEWGETIRRLVWDGGTALIGTKGEDVFRGTATLVLDPGGDDLYLLDPPESPAALTLIVDLGGNDTYQGGDRAPYASGFFGVSLLLDTDGDDRYQTGSFSLGAGWCGVGYLRDRSGFDTYQGDIFTEGAGCCGMGLLWDDAGGDSYSASLESQGFGFVGGVGFLRDEEGRDLYAIRPVYTDVLRYQDHVLSLSQGFSYGWRPDWSGGVGILWDRKGHDVYLSDIFGQGGSYWFGLGLLADDEGHDTYAGFQYVQGSGVHLGVGVLRDGAGNDHYQAKGVSQGCGHDWAPGFLLDEGGEDVYVAADLSQGAGSANGFGLLWDGAGSDAYYARDSVSTQGYGNPRRGYGSIGIVIDAAGSDHFYNRSDKGHTPLPETRWVPKSRWGALSDVPLPEEEEPAWPPDEPLPAPVGSRSIPELFAMASSGEPKFRLFREWGLEQLEGRGRETVDSLLHLLGTPDARDRNTVREILTEMDSLSLAPLMRVLEEGGGEPSWAGEELAPRRPEDGVPLEGWRRRERRLVCDILGRIGSPEALPAVLTVLEDPSWSLRSAAAEALGRIGDPRSVPALCHALGDRHPQVRVKAAWSLGRMDSVSVLPCLVRALSDDYFGVRWLAAEALARRPGGMRLLLGRLRGGDEDLWIMALDAGCRGIESPEDFFGSDCAKMLGLLLRTPGGALSRRGHSLRFTLARLADDSLLPETLRDDLREWMAALPPEPGPFPSD